MSALQLELPTDHAPATKPDRRAALIAELAALDDAIETDPFRHPARFDGAGRVTDMTGQAAVCEVCGAENRRRGAYVQCSRQPDEHWHFADCSEATRQAIEMRYSRLTTPKTKMRLTLPGAVFGGNLPTNGH
jgi:hypothetical protein